MSKDYLNTREKQGIIATLKIMQKIEQMMQSDLFTKEEKSDLKRAITYTGKAIYGKIDKEGNPIVDDKEGVLKRLNPSAVKGFNNSIDNVQVFISDKYEIETYKKRVASELDKAYEENKDYFKLCELILDQNCKNCTCKGSECPFYKVFEEKCIPEFDGVKKLSNCKYAFKTDKEGNVL